MTTDLREALHDLARHTEPGPPPVDLWARGVRRVRRRRAAGATLAVAAVLGVAVGTVKSQTRDALARLRRVAPELAAAAGEVTGAPT